MTQQEALQVLISSATVAQKRGAFSLEEASAIHSAVMVFAPPQTEVEEEPVEKSTKKKN